jgi:hypothetical protein
MRDFVEEQKGTMWWFVVLEHEYSYVGSQTPNVFVLL